MGASSFIDISVGETMGKAFLAAVEQAQYDYGHAGYTGTIAEKGEYTVFTVPPGITSWLELEKVIDKTIWPSEMAEDDPYQSFIRKASQAIDDKWGPCGAMEITGISDLPDWIRPMPKEGDKVFVFFGMASS